jgi:UDP-N-acetylmuramoyl-tripeptide--D-alanyl-D-alanine ligase
VIPLTIAEIATIIDGKIYELDPSMVVTANPEIDSRKVTCGTFFIAMPGERVDGNSYALDAIRAGATFAITSIVTGAPAIVVHDSLLAIQKLASHIRTLLSNCTFIGITGSHGKTTTKDLLGQVLSIAGETVVSEGSFNNELGVPLTILRCTPTTKFCVLEMGARHQGDIKLLCTIAQPQIGLVLVVGSAHIGEFGGQEAIADAKRELIQNLSSKRCDSSDQLHGIAVLGDYDKFTPHMADGLDLKRIIFGENNRCDVRAADLEFREGRAHFDLVCASGRAPVGLRLLGLHQVANALAVAAVALEVGVSIESIATVLSTAEVSSKWRMELHDIDDHVLINDSYNANPESMGAALRTLALLSQERGGSSWAFLGKMHELGASEAQEHLQIGRLASELGIDHLVAIGTTLYLDGLDLDTHAGDEMQTHSVLTQEEALGMMEHIQKGDVLLIKASRAEHLDELSEKMVATWEHRQVRSE